jgi:hypothetical protein
VTGDWRKLHNEELLLSYSMIIFINATLIIVVVIGVFSFCVGCLFRVYFCVLCFV